MAACKSVPVASIVDLKRYVVFSAHFFLVLTCLPLDPLFLHNLATAWML